MRLRFTLECPWLWDDRFWRWWIIHTIFIGWQFYMRFLYLLLSWVLKSRVQNYCQLWLLPQRTGRISSIVDYFHIYLGVLDSWCVHECLFRVPNIKFNVAKVLQSLVPIVDQSVSGFTLYTFSHPTSCIPNFIIYTFELLLEISVINAGGRKDHSAVFSWAEWGPRCWCSFLC